MSQYDPGTIDPNTKDGASLASDLNSWRDALHSLHRGVTSPGYASAGMLWVDDSADPIWELKLYDGTAWISLLTIDTNNNTSSSGVKNNLSAISTPTSSDDSTSGYSVGSIWIDVTNDNGFLCVDDLSGSAVWNSIGGGGGSNSITGEIKLGFFNVASDGWVLMDDGTIGNASSSATTRANTDTEDLFKLLWNNISDTYAPVSSGRGASAQADYDADKTIALPKQLGRQLLVAGTGVGLTSRALGETGGSEDAIVVSHSHSAGSLSASSAGNHNHTMSSFYANDSDSSGLFRINEADSAGNFSTNSAGAHTHSISGSTSTDGSSGIEANMSPYSTLNIMIKL